MAKNDEPDSGPIGNPDPSKRGRGSGSGPDHGRDRKGRPTEDPSKGTPDKGKGK